MRLSALSTAAAARAGVLCCVLFMAISAQALAQTSATDNPGPTAAQPSAPAPEKPAAAEEKPPATDDKPATAEHKPAPAEEKPAIAQDKPAAAEEKAAATDDKPAVVEQKPALAEAKPAAAQDKPAAVEEKAAAKDDKPAVVEQKPAVPDAKPAVAEQKPAPAVEKTAVAQKPALKRTALRPSASAVDSKRAEPGKSVQAARQQVKQAASQPVTAARKPRERKLVMVCTSFRTYNPSTGTYRGYDGLTHSCR